MQRDTQQNPSSSSSSSTSKPTPTPTPTTASTSASTSTSTSTTPATTAAPKGKAKLTKRQREKKHEEEKANRALGGAQMKSSSSSSAGEASYGRDKESSSSSNALQSQSQFQSQSVVEQEGWGMSEQEMSMMKPNKDYVELQWFKLLRKQKRLDQIASILVSLAPSKVFDPRDVYEHHLREQKKESSKESKGKGKGDETEKDQSQSHPQPQSKKSGGGGGGGGGKGKGKGGKQQQGSLSKKDQIIAANKARLDKDATARDFEKLNTLGAKAGTDVKLSTESGKLMLMLQHLRTSVRNSSVVDVLDTLWEVEDALNAGLAEGDESARKALSEHEDTLKEARKIRGDKGALKKKNIVDFQLTEMSDRLPPLNKHSMQGKFKLDPWQLKVITLIEAQKSVLITAPTSSGKTVLSTYVCKTGGETLFVVPTEPLAWQVGAMLRALKLDIALVVPTLNFVPPKWDVVVGTPGALESTLTKQIGFDFQWAIFDEVHSLNNEAGAALQRLIRAVPKDCRFMALSATIGNAEDLKAWWETIVGKDRVELVEHQARFINLQRHVWTASSSSSSSSSNAQKNGTGTGDVGVEAVGDGDGDVDVDDNPGELHQLHPCACLSPEYLREYGFSGTDMALAPVDTYKLWKALDKTIGKMDDPPVSLKSLRPKKFFNKSEPEKERISLDEANRYEQALKGKLEELAKADLDVTREVLASLAPTSAGTAKAPTGSLSTEDHHQAEQENQGEFATQAVKSIMDASTHADTPKSLTDLTFMLRERGYTPAIVFQLDSVRCQGLFDGLLHELEERETKTHPEYRAQLRKKKEAAENLSLKQKQGNKKQVEEEEIEAQEFGETTSGADVDLDAPHEDFMLTPPGKGMGITETQDIQEKLRYDLPGSGDAAHPLIRALRRGVGMYIEGLPSVYLRVVQTFAQQGRLGVVLSDELLAYGVNMPFRSAAFFGDPGRNWLTPLMHQQMAGRAGRRGLDRQGHLVYAGFTPERLRELLRGELPAVIGRFPLYPIIPLQAVMNDRMETSGRPLDERRMRQICSLPLGNFLHELQKLPSDVDPSLRTDIPREVLEQYFDDAKAWIHQLGVMKHPLSSYSYLIPELVWELREFLPESVAIEYLLEPMITKFRNIDVMGRGDQDASDQFAVMLIFCRICGREPLGESLDPEDAKKFEWIGALPSPHKPETEWDYWTDLLEKSQERIQSSSLPHKDQLLLPVDMDRPLDNQCYASFVRNQIDPSLPTPAQHRLRARLWRVGEVLRICSNVLGKAAELQPVQNLIRKAFLRVRYILDETFERNWKDWRVPGA